ncbi:MAG: UDP-N-acetylmuramoyl-L-alanine--D-glutamate ligase [Actinomycetota bacterium]
MTPAEGYAGVRALVVGLGASGLAAARALHERDAKVRVTEESSGPAVAQRAATLVDLGVEVELGGHDLEALDADLAVVSPGIPPSAPVMRALARLGVPVIGEVELAWRLARCEFLAVTGTNGKTTTTSLLAAMLREAGVASVAAGNIGLPLIDAVAAIPEDGAIAVEVSSFQLATIDRFRPRVAVVLNVAEDHTDWHGSVEGYAAAKARITVNQTGDDVLVVNADDHHAMAIAGGSAARVVPFWPTSPLGPSDADLGVRDGMIVWRGRVVMPVADVALPGAAGLEDTLAAAGAALEYGLDPRAVTRAATGFQPLAHRLQPVAEVEGVTYIDDSKATNPHATLAAVRGLSDVVLIAGGRSKGVDLTVLEHLVPPVIAVVVLGEAADELERLFESLVPVQRAATMREAVAAARGRSVPGGSVLLSPACASLDMYDSYAQRGQAFARAVMELEARAARAEDGRGTAGGRRGRQDGD